MRIHPAPLVLVVALAALVTSRPASADDLPKEKPPEAKTDAAEWVADFDAAAARAKAAGKDLFVDFTGSDWCGWCVKLHDEVFSKDEFLSAVTKDYVLVALDYPRGAEAKAKVPNEARNVELKGKYAIRGYPTILLMTSEGDVYGQTGYQAGGPVKYVEHLTKLRTEGKAAVAEAMALQKELDAAKGDAKAPLVDKALAKLAASEPGSPIGARYAKAAQAGLVLDPRDEKGLKSRVLLAILDGGHADAGHLSELRAMDPKNEKQLFEKSVAYEVRHVNSLEAVAPAVASIGALEATGNWKEKETRLELLAAATFMCKQHLKQDDEAKGWARKLREIAPKDDQRLQGLLKFVLGDEAEEPAKDPAKEPAEKQDGGPAKDPEQK